MTRPGGSAPWLALPLVTVIVFALLLTVSLQRMVRIESDMRVDAEQNMLWVMHESEAAARRLKETALLAELGRAQEADIALHLDILRSRVALLNDGPQRRFVEHIGLGEELNQLTAQLDTLAPLQMTPASLQAALAPFPAFFSKAANKTMIAEWDELGGRLESYRGQLRKTILALIGVMAAGAVLTAALVLALRKSRQHNRMLRRERDFSGLLIASSGEGIAAIDASGRCTLWNEAMAHLVGQSAQQAVGRALSEVAGFFAAATVRERLAEALAGTPGHLQLRPLFRNDAEAPIHVDLRAFPMRDETGIVGAIVFMQDASDRHAVPSAGTPNRASGWNSWSSSARASWMTRSAANDLPPISIGTSPQ
ncbi:PAS domain-containing protein [Ponticoccus litoralis]|uniref:PAS domain-containing protein n=1 Tax=Ponticoccus litoralis TaxID=422297 RepID=A0AAW9SQD4_9RHOB